MEMNGKQVVNLIDKLQEEGFSAEKILEIVVYTLTNDPTK